MNTYFLPTVDEREMVLKFNALVKEDYALIRLTSTMLKKSIIDASEAVRYIIEKKHVIDYEELIQGQKKIGQGIIFLENTTIETKVSYYKPKQEIQDFGFMI